MKQTLSWACLSRSEAAGVKRSLCRHCYAPRMIGEAEGGPGTSVAHLADTSLISENLIMFDFGIG
jgi:hypothetical protein